MSLSPRKLSYIFTDGIYVYVKEKLREAFILVGRNFTVGIDEANQKKERLGIVVRFLENWTMKTVVLDLSTLHSFTVEVITNTVLKTRGPRHGLCC